MIYINELYYLIFPGRGEYTPTRYANSNDNAYNDNNNSDSPDSQKVESDSPGYLSTKPQELPCNI